MATVVYTETTLFYRPQFPVGTVLTEEAFMLDVVDAMAMRHRAFAEGRWPQQQVDDSCAKPRHPTKLREETARYWRRDWSTDKHDRVFLGIGSEPSVVIGEEEIESIAVVPTGQPKTTTLDRTPISNLRPGKTRARAVDQAVRLFLRWWRIIRDCDGDVSITSQRIGRRINSLRERFPDVIGTAAFMFSETTPGYKDWSSGFWKEENRRALNFYSHR